MYITNNYAYSFPDKKVPVTKLIIKEKIVTHLKCGQFFHKIIYDILFCFLTIWPKTLLFFPKRDFESDNRIVF